MRLSFLAPFVVAMPAMAETQLMSPADAYAVQQAGGLVIVDIRRPDEWADTGIAAGAVPLDMRAPDFLERLMGVMRAADGADLAVICRSGGRSAALGRQLDAMGIGPLVDIEGGTLAWIEQGLPIEQVD